MYQKKKGVLLILMSVMLLLEFVAYLISVSFAVQLVIISAAVAVAMRFFFLDMKEEESEKRMKNYMRKLR